MAAVLSLPMLALSWPLPMEAGAPLLALLIGLVIGSMVVHNLIIMNYFMMKRRREQAASKWLLRFDRSQVFQHLLLILSFGLLVITGFAPGKTTIRSGESSTPRRFPASEASASRSSGSAPGAGEEEQWYDWQGKPVEVRAAVAGQRTEAWGGAYPADPVPFNTLDQDAFALPDLAALPETRPRLPVAPRHPDVDLVVIGASTGGDVPVDVAWAGQRVPMACPPPSLRVLISPLPPDSIYQR